VTPQQYADALRSSCEEFDVPEEFIERAVAAKWDDIVDLAAVMHLAHQQESCRE